MIVHHKSKYNPKIDFLACKQLLNIVPLNCDELAFRDCFYGKRKARYAHERRILKLKEFFQAHDIANFADTDIHELYRVITKETWDRGTAIFCDINTIEDVVVLAKLINKTEVCDKYALFRVLLLNGFYRANKYVLIPYRYICRRIYDSAVNDDLETISILWRRLCLKTHKYMQQHDIAKNDESISQVTKLKGEFLKTVGALNLYMYGSLAVGDGNEYSDLDLLVVFPNNIEMRGIRAKCYEFWKGKIYIPIDIHSMMLSQFEQISAPAIKRTMKEVGGGKR